MNVIIKNLIFLWFLFAGSMNKHSGFEKNADQFLSDFTKFSEKYQYCALKIASTLEDVDLRSNLNFLQQNSFVNQLNELIFCLNDDKDMLYKTLKSMFQEIITIHSQSYTFDMSLDLDYGNLIKFIANLEKEEMSETLSALFADFIGFKNIFFFTVKKIKENSQHLIINTINLFDAIETLMNKLMLEKDSNEYHQLTSEKLIGYRYISGFLLQLSQYDKKQSVLMQEINKDLISLNKAMNEYDDALEALYFYYRQRYVKGVSDEFIENQIETAKEVIREKEKEEEEAIREEEEEEAIIEKEKDEKPSESYSSSKSESKQEPGSPETKKIKVQKEKKVHSKKIKTPIPEKVKIEKPKKEKVKTTKSKKEHSESEVEDKVQPINESAVNHEPTVQNPKQVKIKVTKVHFEKPKPVKSHSKHDSSNENAEDITQIYENLISQEEDPSHEDPVRICDNVILGNYGLTGVSIAFDIESSQRLSPCENIDHSCCKQEEISQAYESFKNNQLSALDKTYEFTFELLKKLLLNYHKYNKFGYRILKNPESSQHCKTLAKNVIFKPIAKDSAEQFLESMTKSQKFSKEAKANVICWVCDYAFQKKILENSEIVLSRQFCSSLMTNMYDYSLKYNMQIKDYLNDVVQLLLCNKETGQFELAESPVISKNDRLNELLLSCSANTKYCEDFCQQFSFVSLNSLLEPNNSEINLFYEWVDNKMKELDIDLTGEIDPELLTGTRKQFSVERSKNLENRSISNLLMKFVSDGDDSEVENPIGEGSLIIEVLEKEDEYTDFE